ncbi:MAG TPA: serine hydrolase domain-containing protein [Myxococcota bacterium]
MVFLLVTASLVLTISTPCAQDETRALFEKIVPALLEQHAVPGVAVALVREGEVVWADGFGMADVSAARPVTADTIFNIGSISKVVTAWGVMRLVERGELDLDAPVSGSLTRWTLPESPYGSSGVTARRLMSHTAGLSMHSIPGFEVPRSLPTLEQILSGDYEGSVYTEGGTPVVQLTPPGSEWRYSGGGTVLLQLLIEEISKESFADYMRAEVLVPLGMADSRYGWTESLAARAAVPYSGPGEPYPTYRFTGTAGAGLYSTARDLGRFVASAFSGPEGSQSGRGVLAATTLEEMFEPVLLNDATPSACGLGYKVREDDKQPFKTIRHGGSNFGWQAHVIGVPERGRGLAILTNGDNGKRLITELVCAWMQSELGFESPDCK